MQRFTLLGFLAVTGCTSSRPFLLVGDSLWGRYALHNGGDAPIDVETRLFIRPLCGLLEENPSLIHILDPPGDPVTTRLEPKAVHAVIESGECTAATIRLGEDEVHVFLGRVDDRGFPETYASTSEIDNRVLAFFPGTGDPIRDTSPMVVDVPRDPVPECPNALVDLDSYGLGTTDHVIEAIDSDGPCHTVTLGGEEPVVQTLCTGPSVPFSVGDAVQLNRTGSRLQLSDDAGRLWIEARTGAGLPAAANIQLDVLSDFDALCRFDAECPVVGAGLARVSVAGDSWNQPIRERFEIPYQDGVADVWIHQLPVHLSASSCDGFPIFGFSHVPP